MFPEPTGEPLSKRGEHPCNLPNQMLPESVLQEAHDWEWSGKYLREFAAKINKPQGTLSRCLMEYRHLRGLESPYKVIRRTLRKLIRKDRRITVEDAMRYIFLNYGLMISEEAMSRKMQRIRYAMAGGRQTRLKLHIEPVRKPRPIVIEPPPQPTLFQYPSAQMSIPSCYAND
jgi:hypothetical protein